MRILITSNNLDRRGGSELYVRDIALRLKALGHVPVCFSMECGDVSGELQAGGVEVVSSLALVQGPFDLVHGQHWIETTLAAMAFPSVPVFSFCHGPKAWQEGPAFLPNIVHYAAVDEACRARLLDEGVPAEKITVLLNFADTDRFLPRGPLPPVPRRALVFSNMAGKDTHLPVIQEACAACGIEVDVAGAASGHVTVRPEELLPQYDLVFAKARAAIEAMAVGCAVIQCDYFGAGWLINSERFDTLRPLNFGYRTMKEPLTVEHLLSQIRAYRAEDAARVSHRIRTEATLDLTMPKLLDLYQRVAATPVPEFDPQKEGRRFLERLAVDAKEARTQIPWIEKNLERAREEAREEALKPLRDTERKVSELRVKKSALETKNEGLKAKVEALKAALTQKRQPWWRRLLKR